MLYPQPVAQTVVKVLIFTVPLCILLCWPVIRWLLDLGTAAYKAFFTDEEPNQYGKQDSAGL